MSSRFRVGHFNSSRKKLETDFDGPLGFKETITLIF